MPFLKLKQRPALQTVIMTVICQNAVDVKIVASEGFLVGGERIGEHLAKDAKGAVSHQDRGVHMLPHITPSQVSLGKTCSQKDGQRMVHILYYLRWGQAYI